MTLQQPAHLGKVLMLDQWGKIHFLSTMKKPHYSVMGFFYGRKEVSMEYMIAFLIVVTLMQAYVLWRVHSIHNRVYDNESYLDYLWNHHNLK